jgi:flagellar biosynthetic protein FliR
VNELLRRIGEEQVAGFLLVLARVSPLFMLAPPFSSTLVPVRVRGVIAVALAVGIAPLALHGGGKVPVDALDLAALAVKELLVGLALAFAIAAVFAAISTAGSLMDTLIGFSFGSLVDPVSGVNGSILSQAYSMVGLLVFLAIGGDAWAVQGIARTYDTVGLLAFPSIDSLVAGALHAFTGIFVAALELAAPVMLALVVTDAGFGVVARVVPQFNVFAVALPAKVVIGLLVLAASLPFAAGWISGELQRSIGAALQTLRIA